MKNEPGHNYFFGNMPEMPWKKEPTHIRFLTHDNASGYHRGDVVKIEKMDKERVYFYARVHGPGDLDSLPMFEKGNVFELVRK
jgi:hypothetical protein